MSLVRFREQNQPQQTRYTRQPKDEVDDRETDPVLFDLLSQRFGGFTVDVAAASHNTKLAKFFDRETNGLKQSWTGERVWCNPPYSGIEAWVRKAWQEWEKPECFHGVGLCTGNCGRPRLIVMLLPANRTEQKWWQRWVEPRRDRAGSPLSVEFLPGRPRFHEIRDT